MTPEEIRTLLERVHAGEEGVEGALARLCDSGYVDAGAWKIDTDRKRRRGFPEVIYCASKSAEQIEAIVRLLLDYEGRAFGTRCEANTARAVVAAIGRGTYDPVSRILRFGEPHPAFTRATTAILAAGTSDVPVAEEAAVTLEAFGAPVERVYDVGVAGLHRLLGQRERIAAAHVLIVVAGMEGALPSVVGGLFPQPLIAVPTSVGYGTALGGFTALFGMLTSCASGITVVNIDNGFGAAMAALSILRMRAPEPLA
ncbi:MAG TPA: nickel pincer cofactor biosynthesis protein LarB [Candidatus Kapabacteria bacterium]|nr:nickel pincer cofactor biosynthesis protein LarB [Candidatus Kapabacteria bacterium]